MTEEEHNLLVEKEKERLRAIPFKNKGEFDYREVEEGDCSLIRPCLAAIEDRSKEENPRIFCSQCCFLKSVPGSKKGRMWIAIKGNVSACIAIPLTYFKSNVLKEYFPLFGALGIRNAFNKFAPGQYATKFPNDIVCKKHWRKTCGMLYKMSGKYAFTTFGADFVDYPKDEVLREHGLKACCLKRHTENIPSFEDFLCTATQNILDLMKENDDIYKIVDLYNNNYNEFTKKAFTSEINNPKADPSVDGAVWCPDYPNAMVKGYVNGELLDCGESLYDPLETPPDDCELMKKYDLLLSKQLKLDQEIQEELERKEAEEKKQEKKEEKKEEKKDQP